MDSVYKDKGYRNRNEYLRGLSEIWNVPHHEVLMAANLLGPHEDFDGLVAMIQDRSLELARENV